jgi:hypothetical protein
LREKFGINDVAEQGIFLEEANSGSLQDVCLTLSIYIGRPIEINDLQKGLKNGAMEKLFGSMR